MKPSAPSADPSIADQTGPHAARRAWMAVLARASRAELEDATAAVQGLPAIERIRLPETGMVMLRGRIGGTGCPFNLGEASVTRCALRADGVLGVAYVLGRDQRKAELAALFDALLQDPQQHAALLRTLIAPLAARQESRRRAASRAAATSKVEFFTMVRGDA